MAKCAVCVDNIVANIIVADVDAPCPVESGVLVAIDDVDCDIGWVLTDAGFTNPNPPAWSDV